MEYTYIGMIIIFFVAVTLALFIGKYMARIYSHQSTYLDFLQPIENKLFLFCRIDREKKMEWKKYLTALLCINSVGLIYGFLALIFQGKLFLNPAKIPSMDWHLALNAVISFLTSTNLQHYSGESGASYFAQLYVFMFLQFMSAATSLAVAVAVARGLQAGTDNSLGNFYSDFVLSLTRVLLPLSFITAIFFVFCKIPMTFHGPEVIKTLQGQDVKVSTGPVAAMVPIKLLGSNGGGFFGANAAHPFENPNFLSFILQSILVLLLPIAFVFTASDMLRRPKLSYTIFSVMTLGFLILLAGLVWQETLGNRLVNNMGIDQTAGNLEGKEVRFGSAYTAFFCAINVVIPAGVPAGAHDSFNPLSGLFMLLGMQVDSFYGGLGTGWLYMLTYIIITLFIGSLMIGRTPELFGKKIETREIQICSVILISQTFFTLIPTAIAARTYVATGNDSLNWLTNKGPHGFTTMLYEYISSYAGNGSGFESLGDNTLYWNISTAISMLAGRFIPLTGFIMLAGLFKEKKYTRENLHSSISIESKTAGILLFGIIIIVNILSLFPALVLGPLTEHFLINR